MIPVVLLYERRPVVLLYERHIASQPSTFDGTAERWNGHALRVEMTMWDLCDGSTRRAQGTKPLPVSV